MMAISTTAYYCLLRLTHTTYLLWQVEMVIVVGRAGRHVKKEEAMQHIAGWTVRAHVT